MAAWALVCVSTRASAKPVRPSTSELTTSSARAWLPVSSTRVRACGSSQTHMAPCLVKAMGSRSSLASSLSSFFSFLPGLRPSVASMWAAFSLTRRLSTLAGSILASVMKRITH
ncbi:hypothetical protein BW39_01334 [Delftia sp. RIT313]|nr:hypothetical protein BW39_01334 [Delftia sp. RIT313]